MFGAPRRFKGWSDDQGILLSRELHMTDDSADFTPLANVSRRVRGAGDLLLLHEGKTIHQFRDAWETHPRYGIRVNRLADRTQILENTSYFRAACREVAGATNERTAIAAILPPGVLCGHTISVERRPAGRRNASALILVALMNSFPFDWLLRQKAAAHASLYILAELPVPELTQDASRFLAHACLRLSCNHMGYAPLWQEQLGDEWRESCHRHSWPVVAGEWDRWRLRAAMDVIIAQAYGLDRAQYERVLGSFSHRSFKSAPEVCLAESDALASDGLAAFCKERDPYYDIPLVDSPAQPVINLSLLRGVQRCLPTGEFGSPPSAGVSRVKSIRGRR